MSCYRPQRSWAKVIFSQACVKNSVHRGEGVCLSACWDTPTLEQTPLGADTPREQTPPGSRHPQSRHPPGADPLQKQTAAYGQRAAGTHPTGMHSCYFCCNVSNTKKSLNSVKTFKENSTVKKDNKISGGSRISLRRGCQLSRGRQHTILPNFPKNCITLKEFGPPGARVQNFTM